MKKGLSIIIVGLLLAGCANRGIGPQAGPKDETPPVELSATPENGCVGFKARRIEVTFNEYLELDNVGQNLLMSPPQQNPPEVKVRGKRLLIHFTDSLRDSTTYTLDFGNAVCDFTERNPYKNYTYSFSTGDVIDTLEVRGKVYEAQNLNPVVGAIVGIQSDWSDSAFEQMPLLRIARTDSTGSFRIANIRAGDYRLYGLYDISRDYRLTVGEPLAFADELLTPEVHPHYERDSLGKDSLIGYDYGPADLELFLFKEAQQRVYLQRTTRDAAHTIRIAFSAAGDSMPIIRCLDDSVRFLVKYTAGKDTATLWLPDSSSIAKDSLYFEVRYRRTDSLYHMEWGLDTVRAIWRAPRMSAKAAKAQARRNRHKKLELRTNARQGFELNDTLFIACTTPLVSIATDSIHLLEKIDSIYKPVACAILPNDTFPMRLQMIARLGAGKQYEVRIDSAAMRDIYGVTNHTEKYLLQMKTPEDYSTIRVKIAPFDAQVRIQVINGQDQVVQELPASAEGAFFQYLKPDTYYLRMYKDVDGNGRWTTGSWTEHRQPERIIYYPESVQTKSNWDFDVEWQRTGEESVSKPAALIKVSSMK